MKLGIIGLDCSHAVEFSRMLNDPADREHIPGYRVTAAWPGRISKDFDMSRDRMEPFTGQVSRLGVKLCGGIEEVMEQVDAVFLEQVDARLREEQLERILPFGKPVFVDKPLALSADSARRICRLARQWDCPVMSAFFHPLFPGLAGGAGPVPGRGGGCGRLRAHAAYPHPAGIFLVRGAHGGNAV